MIHFDYIEIEGFRSVVKPMKFNLDRVGLNLMKGPNGIGKTTVFEALVWDLYGINVKDTTIGMVATWPEVRPSTWKGTRVSTYFHVDKITYCITRHLGYKGLTYEVQGEDHLMIAKGDQDRGQKIGMLGVFPPWLVINGPFV